MDHKNYKKLQNGSDIRGVALPLVPDEPVTLTPEAVSAIAAAFVRRLSALSGKPACELRIAVGSDSRLSADSLRSAAAIGIISEGADCADCHMASTPAMFMSTVMPDAAFDGSVMITASHLPANRNGMKFFTSAGGFDKSDISALLDDISPLSAQNGKVFDFELMPLYSSHLRRIIINGAGAGERPLEGFKIAVDAGNGAGGFFARDVLAPLGADVSASRFLEPDGYFPNHVPNPEDHTAMKSISEAVIEGKCDLGVIFDTDVDRAGAVDSSGMELSRNRLIGLMAAIVSRETPGSTVVTDSVTSDGLAEFLEKELGCVHHRFKRGYKNVINESIRLNESGVVSLLAMETSGHGALKENYFLDDGAYICSKIIIALIRLRLEGKSLSSLIEKLKEPLEAKEIRIRIDNEDFRAFGQAVLDGLSAAADTHEGWKKAEKNYEGVRVSVPEYKGWFLLRLSLHDPILPLNIESDVPGGAQAILDQLSPILAGFGLSL